MPPIWERGTALYLCLSWDGVKAEEGVMNYNGVEDATLSGMQILAIDNVTVRYMKCPTG
jgi:hypothetical protein